MLQTCVVKQLTYPGRCFIDVICVAYLEFFEVVIRDFYDFEPAG